MLNHFIDRQLGLLRPRAWQQHEIAKLTYSLEFSETKEILNTHNGDVTSLDFDLSECQFLLSGSLDGSINIFDMGMTISSESVKFEPIVDISREFQGVAAVQWYPHDTGMFLSLGYAGKVTVWDTNTTKKVTTMKNFTPRRGLSLSMSRCAFSHYHVAVGSSDPIITLSDLRTGLSTTTLAGHTQDVYAVQWSPTDPFVLASGSGDCTLRLWDIRKPGFHLRMFDEHFTGTQSDNDVDDDLSGVGDGNNRPTKRFRMVDSTKAAPIRAHDGAVMGVVFEPRGHQLLSTGVDNRMRLWDVATGANKMVHYPRTRTLKNATCQLAVSTNGDLVFHPQRSKIHAYEISTGRLAYTLEGHAADVVSCCYHPALEELYSGSRDTLINVWAHQAGGEEESEESESDDWED